MTVDLSLATQLDLSLLDWVENFTKRRLQLRKSRCDIPDEPEDGMSEDLP